MRYASVCDGIGAVHAAWPDWECVWTSEIEPFPVAVVEHHWGYPNLGDMEQITEDDLERHGAVDLVVGGTPCQSFSVAGLRAGLDDPRGNLALVYLRLAHKLRARWLVWENVPGVLSSNGGRDFGAFLGALAQLGYGWAYRCLDAQYFGLAQRRKRVFVVGHFGDWRCAGAALLEWSCLQGHPAPRREEGARVADSLTVGANQYSGFNGEPVEDIVARPLTARYDSSEDGTGRGTPLVAYGRNNTSGPIDTSHALNAKGGSGRMDFETETFVAFDTTQVTSAGNYSQPKPGQPCHPIAAGVHPPAVAFQESQTGCREYATAGTLRADGPGHDPVGTRVRSGAAVRRLTPRECERLQGFPDDYTRIPWRGKPAEACPDGPRYRALGNSMAVPVMRWIGERIEAVEGLTHGGGDE